MQFIILVGFGALCFGCGYLTAFILTRNKWRDEMIKRGVARYNWQTGKWDGALQTLGVYALRSPRAFARGLLTGRFPFSILFSWLSSRP